MKPWKWAIAAAAALFLAGALVAGFGRSPRAGAEQWGCPSSQVALEVSDLAPSGGYKTTEEALRGWVNSIQGDRNGDGERLLQALDQREGPDRFDPITGDLYLDNTLQAQVGLQQLQDETWAVGGSRYCMRAPDNSSPGATPSAKGEGTQ